MRRLSQLLILTLVVTFFSSCIKNDDADYISSYTVLTKIETHDYEADEDIEYLLGFATYDEKEGMQPIEGGKCSSAPLLWKMKITGGDIKEVEYSYEGKKEYLIIDVTLSDDSERIEKYKLNEQGMATHTLVGEEYVELENIAYDEAGYRTMYEGHTITSESSEYDKVEMSDGSVVMYSYTPYLNAMAFQQNNIVGAPFYLNVTDHFGKQSRHFLSGVIVSEDGNKDEYKYSYAFDTLGMLREELTEKNGDKQIYSKYSYSSIYYVEGDTDTDTDTDGDTDSEGESQE
ncbi:MAG: hypothetical protein R3Y50_04410 [Rikenellaceae bacterium]